MNINAIMQTITVSVIPLIFAITLHEAAHGWVASKFGDKTALMLGRVTLNPAKHIDPIGTILLPIVMLIMGGFIFGWAKPVPITQQNLGNPRRDMVMVALAGPLANLLMAFLWAGVLKLNTLFLSDASQDLLKVTANFIYLTACFGIGINCILFVLNLIPIPPLDGSRIVSSLLPRKIAYFYDQIEPYGIWILLALLIFGVLGALLWPPVLSLMNGIKGLVG